ncbi:LacI family transcriptional regulator [Amycolatopsis acidiphila]|uniref:LacI family transcriptional regulator n=1 Tax=Amycolatopsis acidiphila TaxID=715473 RepID=A0A558AM59_9PSEU|nr:LacI family DNA-binding transcriptional regulator [Amycolatopsis acidiphila]TVT25343.1 LacI family transcriptional regulator [Amycolatopsis acidiphila]UIJ62473.1 LacI family transcriptional regulator [Amycolatopsis acidiphila]GHG83849.1 LacI family transcriptional regulator [Amycolatopsis acidiphila]
MRPVTLLEVARHAGVSQATASRVLNGSPRIPGAGLTERVRKAAAELGYVPNAQAQALARSLTGLVGLVVRDIADPYFSSIARGVQHVAREHDRQVLLSCTEGDLGAELEAVTSFISHRADALILVGSQLTRRSEHDRLLSSELKRYHDLGGQVAVIGQARPGVDSVVPENRAGAAALAEALVGQGHRRFAVLTGPVELRTAVDRTTGFTEALRRHGLEPVAMVPGEFTRDGGFDACRRLVDEFGLARGRNGMCLLVVNDVMAIGAMACLRDRGMRVPQDVQVAGFDDIVTVKDHVPALTTVCLPLEEMGKTAMRMVLTDTARRRPRSMTVRGEVMLRDSTRLRS